MKAYEGIDGDSCDQFLFTTKHTKLTKGNPPFPRRKRARFDKQTFGAAEWKIPSRILMGEGEGEAISLSMGERKFMNCFRGENWFPSVVPLSKTARRASLRRAV
jgi:hypothetical protein